MNKKALTIPAIVIFSLLALYSCAFTPLREYFATDYVLNETVWFAIIDLVWMHLDIIATVALLTFVIFGVYRYQLKGSKKVLLVTVGALLFKYIAAIMAFSIEYGSLDLTGGLTGFLVNLLIELALIALTVFLAHRYITPRRMIYEIKKEAAKKLDCDFEEKPIYPLQKIFSFKNPIQRIIFIDITMIALFKILADIPDTFRYGIFDASYLLVAAFSWFILILIPAIYSYFLALLFFKICNKHAR